MYIMYCVINIIVLFWINRVWHTAAADLSSVLIVILFFFSVSVRRRRGHKYKLYICV